MSRSVLVIADRGDVGAAALAALLRRRGTCAVTLVGPSAFSRGLVTHFPESGHPGESQGWTDAVNGSVSPSEAVQLAGPFDAILCRAPTLSAGPFDRTADSEYAAAEIHAFGLSWLWSRRDVVVNRPTPGALCGTSPDIVLTAQACASVGLATPDILLAADGARTRPTRRPALERRRWVGGMVPTDVDSFRAADGPPLAAPAGWVERIRPERRRVLVAGDEALGPPALLGPLIDLAHALDLEVAEISLARSADPLGRILVLSVNPVPLLRSAVHVEAMTAHLERKAFQHSRKPIS